jgi:hypothetical protein
MNATALAKYVAALSALAICSACEGAAGAPQNGALNGTYVGGVLSVNGRPVTAERLSSMPRYATILPDLRANTKKFEYVISFYNSYADVFDYPKGVAQIGKINDVGGQGCTNVLYGYGKKTFWIVAAENQIEEFTVPQKPLKMLSDSIGQPSNRAMKQI